MPARAAGQAWRSYLRFSVRGLIIVVVLTGVWLGSLVRKVRWIANIGPAPLFTLD